MKRVSAFVDGLDPQVLGAVLALLALGIGVAWVASPGWALIVLSALVLIYIVLPDQREPSQ